MNNVQKKQRTINNRANKYNFGDNFILRKVYFDLSDLLFIIWFKAETNTNNKNSIEKISIIQKQLDDILTINEIQDKFKKNGINTNTLDVSLRGIKEKYKNVKTHPKTSKSLVSNTNYTLFRRTQNSLRSYKFVHLKSKDFNTYEREYLKYGEILDFIILKLSFVQDKNATDGLKKLFEIVEERMRNITTMNDKYTSVVEHYSDRIQGEYQGIFNSLSNSQKNELKKRMEK